MKAEQKIDYIQYSTKRKFVGKGEDYETEKASNRFYRTQRRYEDGTVIMSGNPNTEKDLVIMSGKACDANRIKLADEIRQEIEHGAKVSRIDLCVTAEGIEPLQQFQAFVQKRKVVTRLFDLRDTKMITDIDSKVETMYIGDMKKRGRKGIFRAYNKGVEQGLDIDLSRFELECKGTKAHNNAKRWVEGVSIGNMIRKTIDVPQLPVWVEIMGNCDPLPQYMPEDTSAEDEIMARWHWLTHQVAPALGKAIADDELSDYEGANAKNFYDLVERYYNRQLHQMTAQKTN